MKVFYYIKVMIVSTWKNVKVLYSTISVYPPSSMATARIVVRSASGALLFSYCEATMMASGVRQLRRRGN